MLSRCLCAAVTCLLGAASLVAPVPASAQANVTGQWSKLQNVPVSPVHINLMPNGKIMMWGKIGLNQTYSWDPVTQAFADLAGVPYEIFCAGHVYLGDGRILVPGGHIADFVGLAKASVYNPATNSWSTVPDMNAGRWYPTATTLANGDALVVGGQIDTNVGVNPLPQVYQAATNSWRNLTSAQLSQPLYPMMFLAPNGKVIDVAPTTTTRWLDTSGSGAWSLVGTRVHGWRDYGSAAMYADGKILVMGGGDPPTATAEVIDLNVAAPAWRSVAPMKHARRQLNSTLLPDGTVLVTGGTSGPGHDNPNTPVFAAELWNPAMETWTTMASMTVPRMYHSAAFLVPDGRVMSMGGDGYNDVEVFSPPYLFKGARPTMSGVPSTIGYGQRFTVQSPDAATIQKVTLVRLASVTHAFNQNQRLNVLQFTPGSGTVDITAPANGNVAPPGPYMLFLVNGNGVPSVAGMVMLGGGSPTPPPPAPAPALSSISPSSATAGGPAFTLTVNGSNFASGAVVRWNGLARTTTFVSASRVTAAIPAGDVAVQGTAQVSVLNPSGTASGTLPFTIQAAAPSSAPALASLSPTSAQAGGAAFTLTVNGSNFMSGAVVRWNGAARSTTFVRNNRLRVTIPASDITAAGTAQVSVVNPSGAASGTLPFTITGSSSQNFTLSVTRSGSAAGNGTITSSPSGISCGASCSATFASGATVTLNASASSGGVFAGWSGACSGTASTCTVSMNANKAVTATINSAGTACVPYPQWDPNFRYVGGEKVTRLGNYYIAKVVGDSVWNVNSPPEWTPNYWGPTTCP